MGGTIRGETFWLFLLHACKVIKYITEWGDRRSQDSLKIPYCTVYPMTGYLIKVHSYVFKASLVAQTVKSLPAVRETWVRSLGQEDPLEKEMATYSSILAWKIPWMEESGGL